MRIHSACAVASQVGLLAEHPTCPHIHGYVLILQAERRQGTDKQAAGTQHTLDDRGLT